MPTGSGAKGAAKSDQDTRPELFGEPGADGSGTRPGETREEAAARRAQDASRRAQTAAASRSTASGWSFEVSPKVEVIDKEPGTVRFRFQITEDGEIESVTQEESTVSPAQAELCRAALLHAELRRMTDAASGGTAHFGFRITPR